MITVSSAPSGFQLQGAPPPLVMEMVTASEQGETARVSELQLRIWVDGPYRQPEQVDPMVRQRAAEMNRIPVELNTWLVADSRLLNPLDPPAIDRLSAIVSKAKLTLAHRSCSLRSSCAKTARIP